MYLFAGLPSAEDASWLSEPAPDRPLSFTVLIVQTVQQYHTIRTGGHCQDHLISEQQAVVQARLDKERQRATPGRCEQNETSWKATRRIFLCSLARDGSPP